MPDTNTGGKDPDPADAWQQTRGVLLKGSPGKTDDYCKYMATLCFSAIPVYISILKFVMPSAGLAGDTNSAWEMVPPALFLSSAMVFIYAYTPTGARMGKTNPSEKAFRTYYNRVAKERLRATQIGTVVFTLGVSLGLAEVFGQGWTWTSAIACAPVVVGGLLLAYREIRAFPNSNPTKPGNASSTEVVFEE